MSKSNFYTEDEIDYLSYEMEQQGIVAKNKFIYKNDVCLELYNVNGKSVFNSSQIDFIRSKGGVFVMNMDVWLLPIGISIPELNQEAK